MKDKPANFELLEPSSPEALVPDSWVEPWMVLTAVGILLILGAWLIFRAKKPPDVDPRLIRNAAYQTALAGLKKIDALQARDTAVQCSLILRRYLSVAANDPALFETHEEFISRHDALKALNEAARRTSEGGFTRLASLKYAAEISEVSPLDVVDESRALLETLHHGFHG